MPGLLLDDFYGRKYRFETLMSTGCDIKCRKCTFNELCVKVFPFCQTHLVSMCRPDKHDSCSPLPSRSTTIFQASSPLSWSEAFFFLLRHAQGRLIEAHFAHFFSVAHLPRPSSISKYQHSPVQVTAGLQGERSGLASLFHSSMERNTNEKQRQQSAPLSAPWLKYKECGGLA